MSEQRFDFGVDIPTKITKYTKRFTDLEGFLDEDYDGEHHMLWDNQEECWIHLDDVLCLMEKEYVNIKEENEQLRKTINEVIELLLEEVDLFSDKATEHDIIAYNEMNQFDNKDAYYMCISTKKAIQMLKRCLDE